jgi:hypothetical protein
VEAKSMAANRPETTTRARAFMTSTVVDLAQYARNLRLMLNDKSKPLAARGIKAFNSGQDAPSFELRSPSKPGGLDEMAEGARELETLETCLRRLSKGLSHFNRVIGERNSKAVADRSAKSCDALLAMALLGNLANQLASVTTMRVWNAKVAGPLAQLEEQTAASAKNVDRGVQTPVDAPTE